MAFHGFNKHFLLCSLIKKEIDNLGQLGTSSYFSFVQWCLFSTVVVFLPHRKTEFGFSVFSFDPPSHNFGKKIEMSIFCFYPFTLMCVINTQYWPEFCEEKKNHRHITWKVKLKCWNIYHSDWPLNANSRIRPGLKTVDTIGNCQRPVFSLGVSHHIHKWTNLWKFELNRSWNLRDNKKRKNTFVTQSCVGLDGWFRDLKF